MDPEFRLLLLNEIKAVQDRENYIRNATMSDKERSEAWIKNQDYGILLVGLLEWLPQFREHLMDKEKHREAKQ